ncbi:hypothetical protein KH5H1_55790 [Corallococcus caeni]|nr:hypothetical protein KH5H1_55790 [Corallococcus sp. KH5-1]
MSPTPVASVSDGGPPVGWGVGSGPCAATVTGFASPCSRRIASPFTALSKASRTTLRGGAGCGPTWAPGGHCAGVLRVAPMADDGVKNENGWLWMRDMDFPLWAPSALMKPVSSPAAFRMS